MVDRQPLPDPSALADASELDELRRCLRDVLALLALPAVWRSQSVAGILEKLMEALEASVAADFLYASARRGGEGVVEAARLGGRTATEVELAEAARWVEPFAAGTASREGTLACGPLGELWAVYEPLGFRASGGSVVVATLRHGFPTTSERVVIRSAVALVTTSLDTARALREREIALSAKDEFMAMLGHELRNPLAPIQTALELIRLRGDDDSVHEHTIIERQVGHVVRLVDDLLDVSRITRGKLELKKEPTEIRDVVTQALEMSAPLIEQRGHRVHVNVPSHGLAVLGDCVRLAQVVSNLLTNAAKYTEPGGSITVSAGAERDDVVIRVKDTGIGLAPEMKERIFESFVQEAQMLDRSLGGLGLGLNIVRSITTLHGGEVHARSEGRGRGSEFVVTLPRLDVVTPEHHKASRRSVPEADRRLRILVVDDNVDAAEMLGEVLEALGHDVEVCHDGPSALAKSERIRPDLALVDIGLPVMDGYELATKLRQNSWATELRLIAVTGYGQERDRVHAREAGFDAHYVKPLDFDKLRDILNTPRATEASASQNTTTHRTAS